MARSYEQKKVTTKIMEGFLAGLAGGVAFVIVLMIADMLMRGGDAFYGVSLFGTIFTGATISAGAGLGTSFLVGALLIIVLFGLFGITIVQYLPIIYRLGLSKMIFGAIYGLFLWLLIFVLFLGFVSQNVSKQTNIWVLLVCTIVAGVVMGGALDYIMSRKGR